MSGTCRSVETLSGGEQIFGITFPSRSGFRTSCKATRARCGLIPFHRRGLGSLDTDTLDTAMRALESIRQSGRVVGIISHVSELQSRIPTMILHLEDRFGLRRSKSHLGRLNRFLNKMKKLKCKLQIRLYYAILKATKRRIFCAAMQC